MAAAAVAAATPTSDSTLGLDRPGSSAASWITSAAVAATSSGTPAARRVAAWVAGPRAAAPPRPGRGLEGGPARGPLGVGAARQPKGRHQGPEHGRVGVDLAQGQ